MTETEEHQEDRLESPEASPEDAQEESADGKSAQSRDTTDDDRRVGPRQVSFVTWMAMLFALAALGLASYPFWSSWLFPEIAAPTVRSASELETLAERVDTVAQGIAEIDKLRDELSRLSAGLQSATQGPDASVLDQRIDQLSMRLERMQGERNTSAGGLRTRLENLESEVGRRIEQFELKLSSVDSNLDRADRDLATRLLLMEIDSLFAIAQNHLLLNAERDAALPAWERGMQRLTALDGGDFEALKQSAQREFLRLQDYQPPDSAIQIERLFGMADAVGDWPVKTVLPAQKPGKSDSDKGWQSRLGEVVGSLVRVESVDQDYLGPQQVDRAGHQLRSLLQSAALALARSRPDLAANLTRDAVSTVERVFDTDAEVVSEALAHLETIAAGADWPQPPELNASRAEISRLLGAIR